MFIIRFGNTMVFSVSQKDNPSNILKDKRVIMDVDGSKALFIDDDITGVNVQYDKSLTLQRLLDAKGENKLYDDQPLGLLLRDDFELSHVSIRDGKLSNTPLKFSPFDVYCDDQIVRDMMCAGLRILMANSDISELYPQIAQGKGVLFDDIVNKLVSIHNENHVYHASYIALKIDEFGSLLNQGDLPFLSLVNSDRVVQTYGEHSKLEPYQKIRERFLLSKVKEETVDEEVEKPDEIENNADLDKGDIIFNYNGQKIPLGLSETGVFRRNPNTLISTFIRRANLIKGCLASSDGDRGIYINFSAITPVVNHRYVYDLIKEFQKHYGTEIDFTSISLG